MIARLNPDHKISTPETKAASLRTESDVEQKFIYPFLSHPSWLNIPEKWIRTKEYMEPTEFDKGSGKKRGYIPDYSIWIEGLPIFIVEAKAPDVTIEAGLRDARLYAAEINKRYPPKINPISFILASNGAQVALSQADSETDILISEIIDIAPGSSVLDAMKHFISKQALEKLAEETSALFQSRTFHRVATFMGGQNRLNQQLGVNEFAGPLFPVITRYLGNEAEEASDEIIDRGYVSSDDIVQYGAVLETYLKDRVRSITGNLLEPIITSRNAASNLTSELRKFAQNPSFFGRVQLIVGAVGSGKSTFIKRFYRRLLPREVKEQTRWSFLDFNVMPPGDDAKRDWIARTFVESFANQNDVDVYDLPVLEKIFSVEIGRLERGPLKLVRKSDPAQFDMRRAEMIQTLMKEPSRFAECLSRHFGGERGFGIVVVFDNVDKRDRDQQLSIFEAAQWFKDITRALIIVNLRDSTFEAHREEPPLDAFINAINFYIRPPRFSRVIQRRLELILEVLPSEVERRQEYSLESGTKIVYPSSRLGGFLLSIYLSLFEQRSLHIGAALEALIAKDVRRALGMFADIIVSPHVPTSQITSAAITPGNARIQESRIIRALMRGRYKFYNGRSSYVKNILSTDLSYNRPSNLLNADILEYLIRNRKKKIDFSQEGFALPGTIIKKMSQIGYDEEDVFRALSDLVNLGLVEPESLVIEHLGIDDAVRVHASGFIHMRFFVSRAEYLVGITPDLNISSRDMAEEVGQIWASMSSNGADLNNYNRAKVLELIVNYIKSEYDRRCREHAFYADFGFGGKALNKAAQQALDYIVSGKPGTRMPS